MGSTVFERIGEEDVRGWVGAAAYERGSEYYREGRVLSPRVAGATITARCQGALPVPYDVYAEAGPDGLLDGACSCPVGRAGRCKHVAALLLAWVHRPESFAREGELQGRLRRRPKEELVRLLGWMGRRHGDLELLLDLTVPDDPPEGAARREAADRAVAAAFWRWQGQDGREGELVAHDLEDLLSIAADHLERDDVTSATSLYTGVARGVTARYDAATDRGGHLAGLVYGCLLGLARCLARSREPEARAALLREVLGIYTWDVARGESEIAEDARGVLLEGARGEERLRVADWAWESLAPGANEAARFQRRTLGDLILALQADALSDEEYLGLSAEAELWEAHVGRLLELGRLAEALDVAGRVEAQRATALADLLVAHGHEEAARSAVLARLGEAVDAELLAWLRARAAARGDRPEALHLAERLFWQDPTRRRYEDVRAWAEALGCGADVRERVVAGLEEAGEFAVLADIHLSDRRVDLAVDALRRAGEGAPEGLARAVARAAEAEMPREAIRLHVERVRRLIAERGRANYAEAARLLRRVRRLYRRIGATDEWSALIASLREEHRRLRALAEELEAARL